ncbi:MAG TPA: hypothetical protein VIO60_03260 [Rectinemataceae bacterium]
MKRVLIAMVVSVALLSPVLALDADSSVRRFATYPEFQAIILPEGVGNAIGFRATLDFDVPEGKINPFIGGRAYYGKTETSSYTDNDFYGTLDAGFRLMLRDKPEAELSSLAFRVGIDLGMGYSHRVTTSSTNDYFSFIWEPTGKLEWRVRNATFCLGMSYRGIVSPESGWSYKKNAVVVDLGYFYDL